MREIKFRAWDERRNEMEYEGFSITAEGIAYYTGNYREEMGGFKESDILMQYTGLKDKNGREIYEGDIFRFEDGSGLGVIFYSELLAAYMWHPTDHDETMSTLLPESEIMEVVGNIYENGDLLNDKDNADSKG